MAINSNPGQTSTGGPSQLSRPNQPETVSLIERSAVLVSSRTLRAGAWRRGRSRPPGQHLRAALCCKAGWGTERVKRRDLCSLCRGGRTIVGIEQHPPSEKDAGHPEQSVTDAPQGTAIGVPTRPQRLIAAAASAVVQHGYPRPVKHSVSQSDLGGIAHDDDAALATALGYGRHAREGPEG